MINHRRVALLVLSVLIPTIAHANVVWPALYLLNRLPYYAIPVGLTIEWFLVFKWITPDIKKSAWIVFVMNTVSAIIGGILIALGGIVWEFTGGLVINTAMGWGTFNPATWVATLIIGVAINTYIEYLVVRIMSKKRSTLFLYAILGANTLSVLLAFASMLISPIEL